MWKWSDLKRLLTRKAAQVDIADLGAVMWPVLYPTIPDHGQGDAYQPKDPHITIVIFKDINNPDLGFSREDVMDAVRATLHDVFLWTKVDALEWFGAEQNIPVLRVSHDYLYAYREALLVELEARGIQIDMTFPEYKPHVSITDEAALSGVYPDKLLAGPVEVWWGDVHYKMDWDSISDPKIMLNRDGSLGG